MTESQWKIICNFKKDFKEFCIKGLNLFGYEYSPPLNTLPAAHDSSGDILFDGLKLHELQLNAAIKDGVPLYPVETPVVYNHSLDSICKEDRINLILAGDNPGKEEQKHSLQRYLTGQSGKVADSFFKKHPELNTDFRKNVIILNKSVLHTAKTMELKYLLKSDSADGRIKSFFDKSQKWLAEHTAELQKQLNCGLWIVGYGQMNGKGLFAPYTESISKIYGNCKAKNGHIMLYQHFSMNCFLNDFNKNKLPSLSTAENLREIGLAHRKKILGF